MTMTLEALRQALELTQVQLARRAGFKSQTTISMLERGKVRAARPTTVRKLARALETDPAIIREAIIRAHKAHQARVRRRRQQPAFRGGSRHAVGQN